MSRTGNRPAPPRCTLASMIQEPMNVQDIKRSGWVEQGILVIDVNNPELNMIERQMVSNLGNKLFGRRE